MPSHASPVKAVTNVRCGRSPHGVDFEDRGGEGVGPLLGEVVAGSRDDVVLPGTREVGGVAAINLGSWAVRQGVPLGIVYSASNGALETLTRSWSAEFAGRGSRVNAISPGVDGGRTPVAVIAG